MTDSAPTTASAGPSPEGTLSPHPGSASLPAMVLAQGWLETRLLLRNGEQLLLALVIPLLLLVAGTLTTAVDIGPGRRIDVLVPGVVALAVLSTAFTSVAIATGFERRYGVLKRLGASPLPRIGLLAGKGLAVLLVEALQLLAIAVVGLLLGWHPTPTLGGAAVAVTSLAIATFAFSALGLLLAGTLRAEATLAAANLVYLLLLVGGGVVVPASRYPDAVAAVVGWLPSGALAESLRAASSGDTPPLLTLTVLLGWAVLATLATARTFSWE